MHIAFSCADLGCSPLLAPSCLSCVIGLSSFYPGHDRVGGEALHRSLEERKTARIREFVVLHASPRPTRTAVRLALFPPCCLSSTRGALFPRVGDDAQQIDLCARELDGFRCQDANRLRVASVAFGGWHATGVLAHNHSTYSPTHFFFFFFRTIFLPFFFRGLSAGKVDEFSRASG